MEVESRIESVVVYARGARVRRVATVAMPVPSRLRFAGLPAGVTADTVRSEVDGPAVALAVRVAHDVVAEVDREQPPQLRAARRHVMLAEAETERLGLALDQLAAAPLVVDDPSELPPAPWSVVVAARRQLIAQRAEREVMLREQLSAARCELDEAQRAYDIALEHDARSGSARGAKLHEARTVIELELAATPPPASGEVGRAEGSVALPAGGAAVTIYIDYEVRAARWAPSYVARLDGDAVRLELRAIVAQASGEDWRGVALRLSTAEPARFAELPELPAHKIGRRQREPLKRGFRPAPTGAEELYRDYDAAFPRGNVERAEAGRAPTAPELELDGVAKDQVWDEESSNALQAKASFKTPTPPPGMMGARKSRSLGGGGVASAIGGMVAAPAGLVAGAARGLARHDAGEMSKRKQAAAPPQLELGAGAPVRLDYGVFVMAAATQHERGRLVPAPHPAGRATSTPFEQLALPPGHVDAWDHAYDYAFATEGSVDLDSDAAWHSVALTAKAGTAKLRHVAVPREQADVFRVATISNPFDGPLLPGPIDVYDRGQFLITSGVEFTPPGGSVELGLGVDPQVKLARNASYHEEATGMLRGGLRLVHAIAIDVENLGARAIEVEVRERVPVADANDDDIEVVLGKIDPAWERWTPDPSAPKDERLRGGFRWVLALRPAHKQTLRATYEIKIAGKHELVGGNRREP
ncbi:MAG: DUF4139 domain-containing protein [Kofleriaceae bacterium]